MAVAQDADGDTLGLLARERGRALLAYAYLLCGDRRTAEDLVQDALVRTFTRVRAGTDVTHAEAYVRAAILRGHLDTWRRRQRWSAVRHLLHVPGDETSRDPAPSVATGSAVHAALATLAPQERVAVVLRHVEDLTVPEVAARMGLADGTVKRYLSTATAKLAERLGPVPDDDEQVTVDSRGSR
ncbi:RNA polymerase sigma factor [Cellulomonas wangsupingiae]|uniref:Sigma-70 family RNA polymerase sigma factor n=1 Tax=Cellulomonas wangsupingiae TaxID=2968085 RepID=A0ABY5K794_9CELL|nr:sigma-70 family RNA polymerase sigma factor [Cellulomonas wangsupingiae]MCC2335531.1 sigma-70 family RNA polymerase sigma factor [Cellulomonas wangsupingiae]UUI64298.1 sigma-70 family RNA polymerase sigma factor [Cellulomonas wangsupingiae]